MIDDNDVLLLSSIVHGLPDMPYLILEGLREDGLYSNFFVLLLLLLHGEVIYFRRISIILACRLLELLEFQYDLLCALGVGRREVL
jgi:hypothetical protein